MEIQGKRSSHSSEQAIHSAPSSQTPTTSLTTTIIYSHRWAASTMTSFHRHLGWDDRRMVSERHLGRLTLDMR